MILSCFFRRFFPYLTLFTLWSVVGEPARGQSASHIVISEVYGGGGNAGALYTHDFIELYNPTVSGISMTNWSVQYQSGGGSGPFGSIAGFTGYIPPHGFFLVQANQGSGGSRALPPPDAVAGFSLAATSGKVVLSSDTLPVAGPSEASVVDFVGYGSANLYEGTGPAGGSGNTASIERKAGPGSDAATMGPGGSEEFDGNGNDADDNSVDFTPRPEPEPQNSSAGPEQPGGNASVSVVYNEKWNLVSVPLEVPDTRASSLFPDALTPFYAFSGTYIPDTAAQRGRGYWIKLPGRDTVQFVGSAIVSDTLILDSGWNLVGSVSSPLEIGTIVEIPPGHLQSGFYLYDAGYREASTLEPGRGYWVRSAGGSIVLRTVFSTHTDGRSHRPPLHRVPPGLAPARVQIGELLPPPPGEAIGRMGDVGGDRGGNLILRRIGPNPFNPRTTVEFELPEAGEVEIGVFNLAGRRVSLLLDAWLGAGPHAVDWDTSGQAGEGISSGVYFVRLNWKGREVVGKVMLLR